MHVLPSAVLPLPNPCFFHGTARGRAVAGDPLVEPNVTNYRHLTHDPDMGRRHARMVVPLDRPQVEIELVKIQPSHQLPERFGLETSDGGIAQLLVGRPVGACNGIEELLVEPEDFFRGSLGHPFSPDCFTPGQGLQRGFSLTI
jgi:hypothetical protein